MVVLGSARLLAVSAFGSGIQASVALRFKVLTILEAVKSVTIVRHYGNPIDFVFEDFIPADSLEMVFHQHSLDQIFKGFRNVVDLFVELDLLVVEQVDQTGNRALLKWAEPI